MAGFISDPLATVNLIVDNLRDRYRSDFAVFKEIVQNADDAGATQLVFLLLEGLHSARHPLLAGPALVAINDGCFRAKDAKGIRSFGRSVKAADGQAIGRFGLGQKSVFHLCELFFYIAEGVDEPSEYPFADVINPWADVAARKQHFSEWDHLEPADREAIRKAILPLELAPRHFILWLPLRRRRQLEHDGNGKRFDPLLQHFPGYEALAKHLAAVRLLGGLLPTLAKLRAIRCFVAEIDGENATTLGEARLESGAVTLMRPREKGSAGRLPLQGQVRLQCLDAVSTLGFAGVHQIAADPLLAQIAASERWPTIQAFDDDGSEQRAIRDKAHAQGAALLIDMAGGDGPPTLEVTWAVFLPTRDESEDKVPLEGEIAGRSLRLVLHGYFFLDAGRQAIEALDEAGLEERPMVDDAAVRRSWNRALRDRVLLPLVPEAIDRARGEMKLSRQVVASVCRALRQSKLFKRHSAAICARSSLVLIAGPEQTTWQLCPAGTRVLPIAPQPDRDRGRSWRVMPALADFADAVALSPAAAPNLRVGDTHDPWPDDRLADVLRSISPGSLMRRAETEHVVRFLELSRPAGAAAQALEDLVRRALRDENVGTSHLKAVASQVSALVAHLPRDRVHVVPARAHHPAVIARLAGVPGAPLILPADLVPSDHAAAAPSPTTIVALLGALDELVREGDGLVVEAASIAASTLIRRTPRLCVEEIRGLSVLRAYDWRRGGFAPCSWAELDAARAKGCLFEWAVAQPVQTLQEVLPGRSVLSVEKEIAEAIDLQARRFDATGCLIAVDRADRLGGATARAALVNWLNLSEAVARQYLRAVRFLCHGDPAARDRPEPLLRLDEPDLATLVAASLAADGKEWQILPAEIQASFRDNTLRAIGCETLTVARAAGLIAAAPADAIARIVLSKPAMARLLAETSDDEQFRRLPFHRFESGSIGALDERCFRRSSYPIPPAFAAVVRIIRDSCNARVIQRQRAAVPQWSPSALLRLALAESEPWRMCNDILDALSAADGVLDEELTRLICATPWLALADGPLQPSDVLNLPEPLAQAAACCLADAGLSVFVTASALPGAIRGHAAWPKLERLFPAGERALEGLALLVDGRPEICCVPRAGDWPLEAARALVLAGHELPAPGWTLLAAALGAFEIDLVRAVLLPKLRRGLDQAALVAVLLRLGELDERNPTPRPSAARQLFDAYLRAGLAHPERALILNAIRLPNRRGAWSPAATIAARGDGVDGSCLLDAPLAELFPEVPVADGADVRPAGMLEEGAERGETAVTLQRCFSPWRHLVPARYPSILALVLGTDPMLEALAREWLEEAGESLEPLLTRLRDAYDASQINRNAKEDFDNVRQRKRFAIRIVEGPEVLLTSVTGQRFQATVDEASDSLTPGGRLHPLARCPNGTELYEFGLRAVDPRALGRVRAIAALWGAIDLVLADVYAVLSAYLPGFRERLRAADAGQVPLEAARAHVEEHLPVLLRQIRPDSRSEVRRQLDGMERKRVRAVEFRGTSREQDAQAELAVAREALLECVRTDPDSQKTLVEAVRRKIHEQEYTAERVPFELFQNADDAVVEAGAEIAEACRVDLEITSEGLTFVHRGRPINDLGPDPDLGRERNYGLDLQKMLVMGHSDKSEDERTTGRFGLGFKSVYLVTDEPRILSGWLRLRIVGALLPEPWDDPDGVAEQLGDLPPATQILLPARNGGPAPADYGLRFRRAAGLLTLFGRRIRTIAVRADDARFESSWVPEPIPKVPRAEVGDLRLWNGKGEVLPRRALVLRADDYALVLTVAAHGLEALPADVPSVWVTAPTGECWNAGYICNGPFRVDVGRSRLADGWAEERPAIESFGRRLGDILIALFDQAEAAWPELARQLGVADHSDGGRIAFQRDLFDLLSRGLGDQAPGRALLFALHGPGRGLSRLLGDRPALPTRLSQGAAALIRRADQPSVLSGALAEPAVLAEVADWPSIACRADRLIDHDVAQRCAQLGPGAMPARFGLVEALREELAPRREVEPETALRLGGLLHPAWVEDMLEREERHQVRMALKDARFRDRTGQWRDVRDLHRQAAADADEQLRVGFAPQNALLAADYAGPALQFFELARAQSGFGPNEYLLAKWARAAREASAQRAVLRYVLDGRQAKALARLLDEERPVWLRDLDVVRDGPLVLGFDDDERDRLAFELFRGASFLTFTRPEVPPAHAEAFLSAVHDWWQQEGDTLRAEYQDGLYPDAFHPEDLCGCSGDAQRFAWFTLLAIASFHVIGRTRDEQHRAFLELMIATGTWRELATSTEQDPMPWLAAIEEAADSFADGQPFLRWYGRFFDLYILARWLPQYAHAFLTLPDRIKQTGRHARLRQVLRSATDPDLSGTGIWAPAIDRTLGYGACFVVRELARFGVLDGTLLAPYAWMPTARLRRLLFRLGCHEIDDSAALENAGAIWRFVSGHLGESRARFGRAFDLPLQLATLDRFNLDDRLAQAVLEVDLSDRAEDDELAIDENAA